MENNNKNLTKEKRTYFELISVVNEMRDRIKSHVEGVFKKEDYEILKRSLDRFLDIHTVKIFLEDCKNCIGKSLDFSNTRDFVFQKREPVILSFFKAPYNKEYGLDALVYEIEHPDFHYVEKFNASNANSINILSCTKGFDQYPTCVALFPENFCSQRSFKSGFSVFYFLNVFERRFQDYSKPALKNYIDIHSFWRIKRMSKKVRLKAFATWHYLHEYFHSYGSLPITDYLKIKSIRKTAAIEESRVDMLSVLECLDSAENGFSDGLIYAEFILYQRLISYSIYLHPDKNYDALASHILFWFLKRQKAISIENSVLNLSRKDLKDSLQNYVKAIEIIEMDIKKKLMDDGDNKEEIEDEAKKLLISFADENVPTELEKDNYFKKIEKELSDL